MKPCKICGEMKDLSAFYPHKDMADGDINKCKDCAKAEAKANRQAKPEHHRQYEKQRQTRPERKRQM